MTRAALVLAAIAACSTKPKPAPVPIATDARTTPVVTPAPADAPPPIVPTGPIPPGTKLLLASTSASWKATATELAMWRRTSARDPWTKVRAWQGSLGHAGLGWGTGLHGAGAPTGRDGPTKREGDGRSPAGVFTLGDTFGYGAKPPAKAMSPYTQVDDKWYCVDDPASKHYNRVVDQRAVEKDWSSAEEMRRSDVQYTWVIDVAHNGQAVPRGGSCIFLHVWRAPGSVTTGCTAMEETDITALLSDLDPADVPVLVQLPVADYDALAASWQLPPRT